MRIKATITVEVIVQAPDEKTAIGVIHDMREVIELSHVYTDSHSLEGKVKTTRWNGDYEEVDDDD